MNIQRQNALCKSAGPRSLVLRTLLVLSIVAAWPLKSAEHEHPMEHAPANATLGTVAFELSCRKEVHASFNRAVALVHSFWHDEAEREFRRVAQDDPDCAMAWWGVAFTHAHPILSSPTDSDIAAGMAALVRADVARTKSPREAAYIAALQELYTGIRSDPTSQQSHAARYAQMMGSIAREFPADIEAQAFYGLALIAAAPPDDTSLVWQKRAIHALSPAFKANPDHPGFAHYLIHATDNPQMASQGLQAARAYASIAPDAPHARHMPAHIFARLGLWSEDVRSNLASRAAAERELASGRAGAEALLHALEFLEYAYLQVGDAHSAESILASGHMVEANQVDARYANYHATFQARSDALMAIETQDWQAARLLQPAVDAPWSSQQHTLLARAIAAGHVRDAIEGRHTLETIDTQLEKLPQRPTNDRLAIVQEIHAWAAFARGETGEALAILLPIAKRQMSVGRSEVELPAQEMVAEMLLLDGENAASLKAFKASLKTDPNRFASLLGAGTAAERLGQSRDAIFYYRMLLQNCPDATGASAALLGGPRKYLNRLAPIAR